MPCGRHPVSHFKFGWTSICFVLRGRGRQITVRGQPGLQIKFQAGQSYIMIPLSLKRKVFWFVLASETRSFVAVTDLRLVSGAVAGVTDIHYSIWLGMTF